MCHRPARFDHQAAACSRNSRVYFRRLPDIRTTSPQDQQSHQSGVHHQTVVFHADRGCQYTSAQLARFADRHNLARSVGRTGVCWDNAASESLWATLKVEFYDRYLWPSRAVAKLAVGDWIERVYNRRRRHSALGMISPVDYEERFNQTAQAA